MGGIFSGSKQPEAEHNVNNGMLTTSLSPELAAAGQGSNAISQLLLGGDASGYNKFLQNSGFNFDAQNGTQGVMANQAAKGLLNSGAAGQALTRFNSGLNQTYMDKYLQNLTNYSDLGNKAGQILTSSGQEKNSKQGKPGIGNIALSAASAFA